MTKGTDDTANLDKLKQEYEELKLKYSLPEFYELNKLFDIEETDVDTDFLLRKIRRTISERITAYSRFVDLILNPSNAPMFFFKLIKKIDSKDKEVLNEIYNILGNLEIKILTLDLDYSEEKEVDFIKKTFEIFDKKVRLNFLEVIKKLENCEIDCKKENGRSYFG